MLDIREGLSCFLRRPYTEDKLLNHALRALFEGDVVTAACTLEKEGTDGACAFVICDDDKAVHDSFVTSSILTSLPFIDWSEPSNRGLRIDFKRTGYAGKLV